MKNVDFRQFSNGFLTRISQNIFKIDAQRYVNKCMYCEFVNKSFLNS